LPPGKSIVLRYSYQHLAGHGAGGDAAFRRWVVLNDHEQRALEELERCCATEAHSSVRSGPAAWTSGRRSNHPPGLRVVLDGKNDEFGIGQVALAAHPAALQLRLRQTVVEVAAGTNSTLVLPFPVELLRFLERATPRESASAGSSPGVAPDAAVEASIRVLGTPAAGAEPARIRAREVAVPTVTCGR
jgi:hypothetical protein